VKYRLLLSIAGASMAASAVALPALAQEGGPSLAPEPAESADVAPIDLVPGLPTPPVRPDVLRPDVRPDIRPDVRPDPEREILRLECEGRISDEDRAAVACKWTESQHPRAHGYILERRTADTDPIIELTTRDLGENSFVDHEIRPGVKYAYRVRVVDANGRTIGGSAWERAGVEVPDPDIELLHMECKGRIAVTPELPTVSADEARPTVDVKPIVEIKPIQKAATCEWRPAHNDDTRGYQLWQLLPGEHRELVWEGGADATSATVRIPADVNKVVFALIAIDHEGEVLGRSRTVTVTFPRVHDRRLDRVTDRPVDRVSDQAVDTVTDRPASRLTDAG
jgi:hypothetical protein